MMVRWMCGVSLKDRNSSEDLCSLFIQCVADEVSNGLDILSVLKSEDDKVSSCRDMEMAGVKCFWQG